MHRAALPERVSARMCRSLLLRGMAIGSQVAKREAKEAEKDAKKAKKEAKRAKKASKKSSKKAKRADGEISE